MVDVEDRNLFRTGDSNDRSGIAIEHLALRRNVFFDAATFDRCIDRHLTTEVFVVSVEKKLE